IDVRTQRRLRAELHIATLLDLAELEGPLPSAVATQLSDDTQRHLEHARAGLIPSRPLVAPLLAVDLDPVLDAELLHPIYARALRAMARPSAERRLAQSPLEHLHPIDAELAERLQTFHGLLTIGQLAAYRGVLDARVQRERPHTRDAALHRLRHALRPAPDPPSEVDVHAAIERGCILDESVTKLKWEHAKERFGTEDIELHNG